MKDQPKHTTGEWFAKQAEGRGYFEWYVGRDGEARAIASDITDPETGQPSEANARLIAAAPKMADEIEQLKQENAELLDALKDMLSGWRYIRQDPAHKSIYGVGWDRAQAAAEAAIVKAKRRGE